MHDEDPLARIASVQSLPSFTRSDERVERIECLTPNEARQNKLSNFTIVLSAEWRSSIRRGTCGV